jgi:hypothetical protein
VQQRPFGFTNAARLKFFIETLSGGPRWQATPLSPKSGTLQEQPVLFWRDPLETVAYLLSNPRLADGAAFAPCKRYSDDKKTTRIYNEMNTGDWWWRMQVRRVCIHIYVANVKLFSPNFLHCPPLCQSF